jgi:beta-glucosidase
MCVLFGATVACGGSSSPAPAGTTSTTSSGGVAATTTSPATSSADDTTGTDTGAPEDPPASLPLCDDAEAVEARIDAALATLSIADKVQLLHGASLLPVEGTWLVDGNPAAGVPGLHMLDGPRGVSAMAGINATAFPVGSMRGATWDPELERQVGAAMAREIRGAGADVILAPTINVLRHPGWGRAQETYGEDTHHIGTMAVAFIEGVQSEGVVATAKHFAANSIEDTRFDVDITLDERTLREVYLPHFRRAVVDARVGAVMSAYNSVNGFYCDNNARLLTDILREDWGFSGLVMSDWIFGTHAAAGSLRAGLDIEMPTANWFSGLAAAVQSGELDESDLDTAVRRVIRVQWCFGLDVDPPVADATQLETVAHLALARQVATRGMVLLRNEGALPLSDALGTGIIVMGPLADVANIGDGGSSAVSPTHVVTALEGLLASANEAQVTHLPGATVGPAEEAAIAAADAVVLVAGLTDADEGEGLIAAGDRDSLLLPASQVALIESVAALGVPTVVVLYGGGSIVVSDWVDGVDAVMLAFYPGSEGGHALADLLWGNENPSGRLPFSVPTLESDLPPFDHVSTEVEYEFLHGYRHLDSLGIAAQFPFGFGGSYTTFSLAGVDVGPATITDDDTITVAVDVTNTGPREGIETVQVYVGRPRTVTPNAPRDLRAFGQVSLQPGETQTVMLSVQVADLRYFDATTGAWRLEPGDYPVTVGTSSADAAGSAVVTVSP